jgi:hypothetical protein
MNVSRRSANLLQEAGVLTTAPAFVAEARGFVESQMGEEVTTEHAKRLKKLWKPPRISGGARRRPRRKRLVPLHQPLWLVPLKLGDWDAAEVRAAKMARPAAAKRIRAKQEKLAEFSWDGRLCERLERGHLVLQWMKKGRRIYAHQAAHVVGIRHFRGARGARRMIVFLAIPARSRPKTMAVVRRALPRHQNVLPKGWNERLVRAPEAVHALLNLWAR